MSIDYIAGFILLIALAPRFVAHMLILGFLGHFALINENWGFTFTVQYLMQFLVLLPLALPVTWCILRLKSRLTGQIGSPVAADCHKSHNLAY